MTAFANPMLGMFASGGGSPNYGAPVQQALGVQDYNQRLRQNAVSNTFDAQKLQMAYAQMRGSTPTQGDAMAAASPMVSSIRAAKNLSRSTMLNGIDLSPDDQSNLDLLGRDNAVSPGSYDQQLQKVVAAHAQNQELANKNQFAQTKILNAQEDAKGKFQYAQSLANDPNFADEETRNQIRSMVSDPKTSLSELRITAAQIAQQKTATQKQTDTQAQQARTENLQNVKTQLSTMQPDVTDARKSLLAQQPAFADLLNVSDQQVGPELTRRLNAGQISQNDITAFMNYKRAEAPQRMLTSQLQQPSQSAQGNGQYPDGTILHSPSTGRVFKVVNGQYTELSHD